MLAYASIYEITYYAQNYAGIITNPYTHSYPLHSFLS